MVLYTTCSKYVFWFHRRSSHLASLDFGIAKTVYVQYPILRDKIATQRKTPTCKQKELHPWNTAHRKTPS